MIDPTIPLLPGGVGLTHLRVYASPSPDGLRGGSPHVHFTCTECYYIQAGRGRVQTLSADGYRETPLEEGQAVWFSPGVIHRLINEDSRLEIFVVMQNGGLPEAGDFVLTLPEDILQDAGAYFQAASLSVRGEVFTSSLEAAYARRDLAVEGFAALQTQFAVRGVTALQEFYENSLRLVQPKIEGWRGTWRASALHAAQETGREMDALQQGDVSHLLQGQLRTLPAPGSDRKFGMCGLLGTYLPEGTAMHAEHRPQEK